MTGCEPGRCGGGNGNLGGGGGGGGGGGSSVTGGKGSFVPILSAGCAGGSHTACVEHSQALVVTSGKYSPDQHTSLVIRIYGCVAS